MTFSFKNNIRIFLDRKIGGVWGNAIFVLSKDLTKEIPHLFRVFFQENLQIFFIFVFEVSLSHHCGPLLLFKYVLFYFVENILTDYTIILW